jgi:protein TonB
MHLLSKRYILSVEKTLFYQFLNGGKKMEAKKNKKVDFENKRGLFFEIGMIVALLAMILVFDSSWGMSGTTMLTDNRDIIPEDVVPIVDIPDEPINVAPPIIISDLFTIVDETANISAINFVFEPNKNYDKIEYIPKKELPPETEVDEVIPEALLTDKCKFDGGDANMFSKWVNERIKYPEEAVENNVEGKVMLSFIVDIDGSVKDVKVLKRVDAALDKEAVRVVSSSPKWTPGLLKGKPVRAIYNFPVVFRLK